MDPLKKFPPEVVHQIWVNLEPKDLLACRAVSTHWLDSVTACDQAWFTEYSNDWYEFLAVRKTATRWTSGKVRRSTFNEIRDCLFSEVAFYLLFANGRLEMRCPSGNLVRVFEHEATAIHQSDNSLMVGVYYPARPHMTFITDFALNVIECLSRVEVICSSPKGYTFFENGDHFFKIGNLKVASDPNCEMYFLDTGVVSLLNGIVVKTLSHFDAEAPNPVFNEFRTVTSSPRWIPKVTVVPGPRNFFGVTVEQRDFTRFFLYLKTKVVEEFEENGVTIFFQEDFFVRSNDVLNNCGFIELVRYEYMQRGIPRDDRYPAVLIYLFDSKFKNVITERWSLFKNFLIFCDVPLSKNTRMCVKNKKKYLSIVKLLYYTEPEFYFKDCILISSLQKFTPPMRKWDTYQYLPNYAYKVEKPSDFLRNGNLSVHLIYLDL